MSVRSALLAILDLGPCYGYQLRAEYERRTAAVVNVGQVYTTLERLARDGMVSHRGADELGHVYWGITDRGRREAAEWFATSDHRGLDDLARKVALAATLPGVDAAGVIAAQREAAATRSASRSGASRGTEPSTEAGIVAAIAESAQSVRSRAELEWLDAAAELVVAAGGSAEFGLSEERPRRGRPAARPPLG